MLFYSSELDLDLHVYLRHRKDNPGCLIIRFIFGFASNSVFVKRNQYIYNLQSNREVRYPRPAYQEKLFRKPDNDDPFDLLLVESSVKFSALYDDGENSNSVDRMV